MAPHSSAFFFTPVLLLGKSHGRRSLVGCSPQVVKSQTRLREFAFTFHFHALKETAARSSVPAWRISGTRGLGGLPSMGSHGVGHDWSALAAAAAAAAGERGESHHLSVSSFPGGSGGKESACDAGDPGLIPGWGRPPGEGNGNPLQYSSLENPMGRGAWRAAVHGVAKSWTRPSMHTRQGNLNTNIPGGQSARAWTTDIRKGCRSREGDRSHRDGEQGRERKYAHLIISEHSS